MVAVLHNHGGYRWDRTQWVSGPSHVLDPLDGSPLANVAFSHVLESFDTRITILIVVTPMDAAMSEGGCWNGLSWLHCHQTHAHHHTLNSATKAR